MRRCGLLVLMCFGWLFSLPHLAGEAQAWAAAPPSPGAAAADALDAGFVRPANRTWIYWWWPNGYATREGIVRDLDEMRSQGIAGALVFQAGAGQTPVRIEFMSDEWRALFRFAVEEAAQRGIVITLNLCDAWNAVGPWVTPEHAARVLDAQEIRVSGGQSLAHRFTPPNNLKHYENLFAFAWQEQDGACRSATWIDLSDKLSAAGELNWQVPEGPWRIVRFGSYVHHKASKRQYLETDPLSKEALDVHFQHTVVPAVEGLQKHLGTTLTHVHIDSGEIGNPDWTPKFRDEFQRRRGYDPYPYFAAKADLVVDSPETTERFLEDYERTIGDLMIECYYGYLGELAAKYGLKTHSEAAGYQKPTVDALRALGCNDIAMSEFWSRNLENEGQYIHQLAEWQLRYHDGIKNAASAAHVYGRPIVQAEAYTVIIRGPNFHADLFDLKDVGDRAFCQGLNRMVLHNFILQPENDERAPGYLWPGIGFEFNRKVTWWPLARAWFDYLNRCQYLHQQGRTIADFCYFQGDWVPAYVPAKWALDPPLPPGCDCDTINADALISRLSVDEQGRLRLPDGLTYRYLVLNQAGRWHPPAKLFGREADGSLQPAPESGSGRPLALSLASLRKLKQLVEAGATVIGPRPQRTIGLAVDPQAEAEARQLIETLWAGAPSFAPPRMTIEGSSFQVHKGGRYPVELAGDGNPRTFWVSAGTEIGQGPTREKPEWLQLDLAEIQPLQSAAIVPRAGFGPRAAELQLSNDGGRFQTVKTLAMPEQGSPVAVELAGHSARYVRLLITDTWARGRNVQVAEFSVSTSAASGPPGEHRVGEGRVIWNRSLADAMQTDGLLPDLEIRESPETRSLPAETFGGIPNPGTFDWIHRAIDGVEMYFLANLRNAPAAGEFLFRVPRRQPELWDPVTGQIRNLPQFAALDDGRTSVPLEFAPRQCFFVIFRAPKPDESRASQVNFPGLEPVTRLAGPWQVQFDPKWGGPEQAVFDKLEDWTTRPEPGIRHYSGIATYRQTFAVPELTAGMRLCLDLGTVRSMARVRLNGRDLGVVWCAPWRVELTGTVQARDNRLEVDVVNLWRNRLVGDAELPLERRFTTSNLERQMRADTPLQPSGLLGPVTVLRVLDHAN